MDRQVAIYLINIKVQKTYAYRACQNRKSSYPLGMCSAIITPFLQIRLDQNSWLHCSSTTNLVSMTESILSYP